MFILFVALFGYAAEDIAQPVYLPAVNNWWTSSSLTFASFQQEAETPEKLKLYSDKSNDMNISIETIYRFKKRLAFKVALDYKLSGRSSRSYTSSGQQIFAASDESSSSSGLREPLFAVIYPRVLLKGKWLFEGMYSPSLGSSTSTNNSRGSSLIRLGFKSQWKTAKTRPFAEFLFDRFGTQKTSNSSFSAYNQITMGGGVYGYFDRSISGSVGLVFISVGSRSDSSGTVIPSFLWRRIDLAANYLWKPGRSFKLTYSFSNFPDLDFGAFKTARSNGNAIKLTYIYKFDGQGSISSRRYSW